MGKVEIKCEKVSGFGEFFWIMEEFDGVLGERIDWRLGLRWSMFGYEYREIVGCVMWVYVCGG